MGEQVQMKDQGRVSEWEFGLPNFDDLTPLSQPLISPELASAFSIIPEPYRTMTDVNRASESTLSNLRIQNQSTNFPTEILEQGEDEDDDLEGKNRRAEPEISGGEDDDDRRSKRSRLVWTPQLHKRFVHVVGHLGIKNAVPKTIMQTMNVEGLTRENVSSHLQKYRLYLKRMQGVSRNPMPAPYGGGGGGQMMSMQVWNGHGHMGMPVGGMENMYRDWPGSGGGGGADNKFHSISSYPNVDQSDR